jgi:hypothetical protein
MLSRLCSGYIPVHPYQIETKDVITSKLRQSPTSPSQHCTATQQVKFNQQNTRPSQMSLSSLYFYKVSSTNFLKNYTIFLPVPLSTVPLHNQQYPIHKIRHSPTFPSLRFTSSQLTLSNPQTTPISHLSLYPLYLYTASSI